MSAADRFKNANTKFSERGDYLVPIIREETDAEGKVTVVKETASYRLKIIRCKWKVARDKAEYYIAEFEVVKSNNPKIAVGAQRNWMQGMDNDAGPTAVTDFMFAALSFDRRNAEELAKIKAIDTDGKIPDMLAETLEDPTDPACKNALAGAFVDVEVKEIFTKANKSFNLHTYFPVKKAA